MRPRNLLQLFILCGIVAMVHAPASAQRLVYRVDLTHTSDHYIAVTLQPVGLRPDTMTFQMPVWAPGVYSAVHYGRYLKDFKATDSKGAELVVRKVNEDRWKIVNAENIAEISYTIGDSRSDANGPEVAMAKIDDKLVLANAVALFGYIDDDKGIPITLSYRLPDGWMIATPLSPATEDEEVTVQSRLHQTIYNADDFEELADAPILAQPNPNRVAIWHDKHADYYAIAAGNPDFPIDSFAAVAKSISKAEISFFRNWPFDEYMFLVDASPSDGRSGALTHDGSSVYKINGSNWDALRPELYHEIAATMFKTWNGKRFHISALGPLDYSQPVSARSLWFNEGGSDYYADLLLTRYGMTNQSDFYDRIDRLAAVVEDDTALARQSIEELSLQQAKYDARLRSHLCAKGALAMMMMDIMIRDKSNNRASLDGVLAKMNQDASSGKTYDDGKFIETISKYSGVDLKAFDSLYVRGRYALPLDNYLALAGATRTLEGPSPLPQPIALDFALLENGAIVNKIVTDTNAASTGLATGDTLVAIQGKKATGDTMAELSKSLSKGEIVKVTMLKNKKPVAVTLRPVMKSSPRKAIALAPIKKPTAKQLAMRKSLLGKRKIVALGKSG